MSYDDNKFAGFKIGYKYEVGSPEYVDMVYKQYNLVPYELMRPEKISDFNNPYVVKAMMIHNQVVSGEFMYNKNITYKENYIKMMENMGIEDELIQKVRSMTLKKFIGASDLMPYMRDYYDYLKGRRRAKGRYDTASEAIDDFRNNLKASLRDMGYDVK